MAECIDGKKVSQYLRAQIAHDVAELSARGIVPGLAVVLVGEDPASAVYVRNKQRATAEVGICSQQVTLPADVTEAALLAELDRLNADPTVHGILVQLPLPPHIHERAVIERIRPDKDVDAFHPYNVGRLTEGSPLFLPCTPAGIMELLRYYHVDPDGQECVIVGRSNIVGKPMQALLLGANGTVTVCHSHTRDLAAVTQRADILVAAVGIPRFITGDMVKPGATVIDVGINRTPDGKLVGDVDAETVGAVAAYLTPVPGGVGPMTITMLLRNTVTAAERAAAMSE